jgi:hypothetical protein
MPREQMENWREDVRKNELRCANSSQSHKRKGLEEKAVAVGKSLSQKRSFPSVPAAAIPASNDLLEKIKILAEKHSQLSREYDDAKAFCEVWPMMDEALKVKIDKLRAEVGVG